jgi:hypothetical protein
MYASYIPADTREVRCDNSALMYSSTFFAANLAKPTDIMPAVRSMSTLRIGVTAMSNGGSLVTVVHGKLHSNALETL